MSLRACMDGRRSVWSCIRCSQDGNGRRGIRGLSILFLIAMSEMWSDLKQDLALEGTWMGVPGVDLEEVLYEDDTAVVTAFAQVAA